MVDFRAVVDRGIRVTAVTRPAGKGDGEAAGWLEEMQRAGVRVILRRDLHEKLAMVDGRVAWFGSLNILSRSSTSDWMMEFADPGFADRLTEVTGSAALVDEVDRKEAADELNRRLLASLESMGAPPRCPARGQPTGVAVGRRGAFYRCTERACAGRANLPRPVIQAAVERLTILCPACGEGPPGGRNHENGPVV